MSKMSKPWYKEGLPFKCTECGQCCTGGPGVVYCTEDEIEQMAKKLDLPVQEFVGRYIRKVDGELALGELPDSYDCVFLKDNLCTLYEARPLQCKTFPWWPQNLKSKRAWAATAKQCEGINFQAPLVSFEEIERQRKLMK